MSASKTDMKQVGDILRMGGSSANLINLALLVVIGWNARDAFENVFTTLESTAKDVVEIRGDNEKLREEVSALRSDVIANQQVRDEFSKYRNEVDAKMAQLVVCVKSRKQCAL